MTTLTVEIPESLKTELEERQIPAAVVDSLVVQTLEAWLQMSAERSERAKHTQHSPFAESALPFIEQLLDDNLELFERLAKL